MLRPNIFMWCLLGILIGAAFRFHAINQNVRFHPDEALFSTFARDAAVHGDWMLTGPLDKSPLTIYASAISMHILSTFTNGDGVLDITTRSGEFAARIPNVFAGLVLVSLIAALARWQSAIRGTVSALAIFFAGASPYLIVFSASAFTDTMMVMFATVSLVAVINSSGWSAGILLALSIACKQQGIVYLSLLLLLVWQRTDRNQRMRGMFIALSIGIFLLLLWDVLRPGTSIFALASANNRPEHLFANPSEWVQRFIVLLGYAGWLSGPPIITWPLLGISAFYTLREAASVDKRLWLFGAGYVCIHCVLALNLYDRYLLPLAPVVIVLASRGLIYLNLQRTLPRFAVGAVLLITLVTGYFASNWRIDLGRDHYPLDREGEIITLADYLNQKPLGTILYDPWLGWESGYYLGPWTNKLRVHYPAPEALIEDIFANPDRQPRYFIVPDDHEETDWLNALQNASLIVDDVYRSKRYVVYELTFPQEALGASDAATFYRDPAADVGVVALSAD